MFYNGLPIILHKFHHANISNNTYMQSANQPIRYEILANNTAAPSGSLRMICSTVISDGGYNPVGEIFSVNNVVSPRAVGSNSIEPILNLRLKPTGATGAERKASVNLKQISITGNTANPNPRIAEIWLTQDQDDSILTSPSWISANDESAVEYDITSTVIDTTNSVLIQSITFESRVPLTAPIEDSIISLTTNTETIGATGVSDIFSIVVNNPAGGNIDILATATWEEIF